VADTPRSSAALLCPTAAFGSAVAADRAWRICDLPPTSGRAAGAPDPQRARGVLPGWTKRLHRAGPREPSCCGSFLQAALEGGGNTTIYQPVGRKPPCVAGVFTVPVLTRTAAFVIGLARGQLLPARRRSAPTDGQQVARIVVGRAGTRCRAGHYALGHEGALAARQRGTGAAPRSPDF
jgi:hypothetical protein